MKPHVKLYFNHFNLGEQDLVIDELEFVLNGSQIRATDIHHIQFGCNKHDDINNLIALSRENHNKAHSEKFTRRYLQEIHNKFIKINPYY